MSLDVQFLPDVDIVCPDCDGSRYSPDAEKYQRNGISLPALLQETVRDALAHTKDLPSVHRKLTKLEELNLGYLTLGEATPALSGGEAQRLKLVSQMNRSQTGTVFVLDEPSVGLHPLDVRTLRCWAYPTSSRRRARRSSSSSMASTSSPMRIMSLT